MQLIKNQLEHYGIRPQTPQYQDVTLALQDTLNPPSDINPDTIVRQIAQRDQDGTERTVAAMTSDAIAANASTEAAATGPGRGRHLSDRARAERRLAYRLVAPAAIVMIAVTGYPIVATILLSLQRAEPRRAWRRTPGSASTTTATCSARTCSGMDLIHTAVITVASVSVEFVLGMLLALAMHRVIFARGLLRSIALVPYAIVAVVAAEAWQYSWSLDNGGWIPRLLGLNSDPLSHQFGTYVAIILTEVWKNTPYMALLLLAGLSLVPDDLLEAAKIDGASTWQRFIKITVPLMKPAILVALLFRTLDAFRIFDVVYIFSQGANNTSTLSMLSYSTTAPAAQPRPGLGGVGGPVRDRRVDRVRVHQRVRRRRQPGSGEGSMSAQKVNGLGWSLAFVVVIVCSLVPVFWLLMLSLKTPESATDGIVHPAPLDAAQTTRTSSARACSPRRCATRSGSA